MKKIVKSFIGIILIGVVLIPTFIVRFDTVKGKTLNDLEQELQKTKDNLTSNNQQIVLTNEQINNIKTTISSINKEIEQIGIDVENLNKEIESLNEQILAKDAEIKKVVQFLQTVEGESTYLEFAFNAKDFTDFIYRLAITEQLTAYNDSLINEYNDMIEKNNKKKEELNQKEIDLTKKQANLQTELAKLGNKLSTIYEDVGSLEDSIKTQEQAIAMYKAKGCGPTDEISVCGRDVLPPDTSFWRPLNSAYISSEYGYRTYYINGSQKSDFHSGIDLAAAGGTNVYPTANGTVASIIYKSSCGGTYMFVHHYVNGTYYTSMYMHLRSVKVNVGDTVTKNTVIATVGGNPSVEWWDGCSTGTHLHFTLLYGRVGTDYYAWSSTFYSKLINPRNVVNFPSSYFSDRTTKY